MEGRKEGGREMGKAPSPRFFYLVFFCATFPLLGPQRPSLCDD
jgi:hypothetical protein